MKRILLLVCLALFLGSFVSAEQAAADRFVNNKDGTVTDTQTGLMWAAQDNGSNINWYDAKSFCEGHGGGGRSGWRMPTTDELAGLYASGGHKGIIKLTACCVWAPESNATNAALFNFDYGVRNWIPRWSLNDGGRALPVRSVK